MEQWVWDMGSEPWYLDYEPLGLKTRVSGRGMWGEGHVQGPARPWAVGPANLVGQALCRQRQELEYGK